MSDVIRRLMATPAKPEAQYHPDMDKMPEAQLEFPRQPMWHPMIQDLFYRGDEKPPEIMRRPALPEDNQPRTPVPKVRTI